MTREEQIKKAAHDFSWGWCDDMAHPLNNGFIKGAEWADQHPQWIHVEERLPEKDNEFEDYSKLVIVTNGKDFWKGMYDYEGECWRTYDLWLIDDATHWMPIVPPRKEEKNDD